MTDPYGKPCDYTNCTKRAKRHFWFHHFCNEHNKHLRQKAQTKQPENLDTFINNHTQ